MQTVMHRIDKRQGPTVWYRKIYSVPVINYNGKEYEKKNIYI